MVQVYFLLILSNLIMGLVLAKNFLAKKNNNFAVLDQLLSNEIFQVTIGCIGTIVGFLALFIRYENNLLILGDLIPAAAAIIAGITLFVNYIDHEESNNSSIVQYIKNIFLKNRTILGIFTIITGIVHFIAPSVDFL